MGTREDHEVENALAALVLRIAPDVVVASGDLTNRGRREEAPREIDLTQQAPLGDYYCCFPRGGY